MKHSFDSASCLRPGNSANLLIAAAFYAIHAVASAQGHPSPGISPAQEVPAEALGQKIFFDTRLSRDGTISCASCHRPEKAFTDGKARGEGIQGKTGTRNTPSLHNAAYTDSKFWDGRRATLTEQVLDPFINPREHGFSDHAELLKRFQATADYDKSFKTAFGRTLAQATTPDLAKALSAYVTSLKPKQTRLGLYLSNQDKTALTSAEKQGLELFRGRARCTECHHLDTNSASLTDGDYHTRSVGLSQIAPRLAKLTKTVATMTREDRERGIGENADIAALGRFVVTLQPTDIGKFKTPSLHEVAVTAPYMHDGSLTTLEAAVDWELYYQSQGTGQPIVLSQLERTNLLSFLRSLTTQHTGPSS